MKRALVSVLVAGAVFVVMGLPAGVVAMADPAYCLDHPNRPPAATAHEERLSFVPPGSECRFILPDGRVVVEGPGWMPAAVAGASIVAALLALRLPNRAGPHERSRPPPQGR